MKKNKILILLLSITTLLITVLIGTASAQTVKTGDIVTVSAKEKIDGMLFSTGKNIDIAGVVDGDIYCAGQTIDISGTVKGDIYCAGQTIRISGSVEGDVRLAGQSIFLSGAIDGSATIAAQSFITENTSKISRDLLGGSESANLNGEIGRDVAIGTNSIIVSNIVGRNIKGNTQNFQLTSSAKVLGNIEYESKNKIAIAEGANVGGVIKQTEPKEMQKRQMDFMSFKVGVLAAIGFYIALMIVILTLALLIPQTFQKATTNALRKPGKTLLTGFLSTIAAPLISFILILSVVGVPLAGLVIVIWIGFAMLSGPFMGYLVGTLVLKKTSKPILISLVGGSLVIFTYLIPFVNILTLLLVYIFGSGIVVSQGLSVIMKSRIKNSNS